jgi:hypothetical protein
VTSSELDAPDGRRGTGRQATIAAALIAATIIVRVVTSGVSALEQGHEALAAGNELGATIAYREAVSWYLPLVSPWRTEAADALWSLHEQQLAAERLPDAARSLQSLRAGLRSADSIVRPDAALKARVDDALAPLMARWEAADAAEAGRTSPGTLAERTAHHASILAQDERPARGWGALAVLGFFAWVGAAVIGLQREGAARWRLLALSALGLISFLAGVALA